VAVTVERPRRSRVVTGGNDTGPTRFRHIRAAPCDGCVSQVPGVRAAGSREWHDAPVAKRVLLIEDDARVRRVLRLALQDEGYDVGEAGDGEQGLEALARDEPDVVLLDLNLPGMDGFTVCRHIRHDSRVPVIMVTARTDSHDIVAGLEAGADDYVTKPLVAKELSARIRALLRRVEPAPDRQARRVEVGDLSVGLDDGVVTLAGAPVSLTRTEFRLLVELALADGRICSREDLLERVWGYGYFGDARIVDVHVRRLRTKVEHDPSSPRHVVTVRGLGYRLAE
jgi:DNA-binding response OmpR family regulator